MALRRDIQRITKEGWRVVWRNPFVSFTVYLTMTITLLFVSIGFLSQDVFRYTLKQLDRRIDLNVYFVPDTPEEEIERIERKLKLLPEVKEIKNVSQEEALQQFLARYENDELIRKSLDEVGDNPFGAYLKVQAKSPEQYETIAKTLESDSGIQSPYIEYVNYRDNAHIIQRMNRFSRVSKKIAYGGMFAFVIIFLLITLNLIGVSLYSLKEEIRAKRILGAEKRYITGPFEIFGISIGFFAGLTAFALLFPLLHWVNQSALSFLGNMMIYEYLKQNVLPFAILILSTGMILGFIASSLATRKFMGKR